MTIFSSDRSAAAGNPARSRPSIALRFFSGLAAWFARSNETKPMDLETARSFLTRTSSLLGGTPPGIAITEEVAGSVDVVRFSSGGSHDGVVLYLHGGAYVLGNARMAKGAARSICSQDGPDVVSVEYRLAPEHPYPAALDDSVAVYRELIHRYGVDRIVVAGESAGGGLALALLQKVRELDLPQPAGLLLEFPWADLTMSGESSMTNRGRDGLIFSQLVDWGALYAGETDVANAGLSPLFGGFDDFPPVYIIVGTHDLLLDDSRRIAVRMREAGVDVVLDEWPGATHGFSGLPVPEGREARSRIRRFILNRLQFVRKPS